MKKLIIMSGVIAMLSYLIFVILEKKGIQYKNGTIFYIETDTITNEKTIAVKYLFKQCKNSISLDKEIRILSLTSTCATDLSILEVADDFNRILNFIKNLNISQTNYIELFLDGKFTRLEYLTRYLNYNSSWNGATIISSKEHEKRVYTQILESKIYNPITNLFKKYECQMTLNSMDNYFGEYTGRHLTKKQLLKTGIFPKTEVNKNIYHGMEWLVFKLKCD